MLLEKLDTLSTLLQALKFHYFIIVTIKLLPKHDLASAPRRTADYRVNAAISPSTAAGRALAGPPSPNSWPDA